MKNKLSCMKTNKKLLKSNSNNKSKKLKFNNFNCVNLNNYSLKNELKKITKNKKIKSQLNLDQYGTCKLFDRKRSNNTFQGPQNQKIKYNVKKLERSKTTRQTFHEEPMLSSLKFKNLYQSNILMFHSKASNTLKNERNSRSAKMNKLNHLKNKVLNYKIDKKINPNFY
jgi:hypothetical protein